MEAKAVYGALRKDFLDNDLDDNWSFMSQNDLINNEFRTRHNGLVYDFCRVIKKVFIVTFPDKALLDSIIDNNSDVLIFSHHPMSWQPLSDGMPFINITEMQILKMKEKRVSFFVLHSPIDREGEYSTSFSFMQALRLKFLQSFYPLKGGNGGVIAESEILNIKEFGLYVKSRIGHDAKVYQYGDEIIKEGKLGILAGGGNVTAAVEALKELGVNTYVTGVTAVFKSYEPSREFHAFAKKNRINVIGTTHYSSEKWACMNMLDYFRKIGLGCVFMPGKPDMNDL